jgi:molybdopterin-biosynthesis enzyme MoeA-like protein
MKQEFTFFALIIGTEILNRRRQDAHFDFVTQALASKGYRLSGSFIIEDDPALIVNTLRFIASQPNPILFSFGGIGSTPDDHTRKCAAIALRNGQMEYHEEARKIIEATLGEEAYPHPVKMAQLPKRADLIENPVNKMPAFSLDERYFFMPGFPEMSHPMVTQILDRLLPENKPVYRYTLTAECKENRFIELMGQMPKEVECSSLPKLHTEKGWQTTISIASDDASIAKKAFASYIDYLDRYHIPYQFDDGVA